MMLSHFGDYLITAITYFAYLPGLLLVLFWLWVGWGAVFSPKGRKRGVAKLVDLKCPNCDAVYGSEAAQRAQQGYIESCEEIRRRHLGYRINFSIERPVKCPRCQRESTYDPESGQLQLVPLLLVGGTEVLQLPPEQLGALISRGEWLKLEYGHTEYSAKLSAQGDQLCVELPEVNKERELHFYNLQWLCQQLAHQLDLTEIEWTIPAPHVVEPQKKPRPSFVRQGFGVLDIPGLGQCFRKVETVEEDVELIG